MPLYEDLRRYRCPQCGERMFELIRRLSFQDVHVGIVDGTEAAIRCTRCGYERLIHVEQNVMRHISEFL